MSVISRRLLLAQLILLGLPVAIVYVAGAAYLMFYVVLGWDIGALTVAIAIAWIGAGAGIVSLFSLARAALRGGQVGLRARPLAMWVGVAAGAFIALAAVADFLWPPSLHNSTEALFRANLRPFAIGAALLPCSIQLAIARFRNEV